MVQKMVKKHMLHIKLNVKRAQIFLRLHKSMKLYRELAIFAVFLALFFGLVLTVLPAAQTFEHASALGGSGAQLWLVQLGADQTAFQAMNSLDDFYKYLINYIVPLLDRGEPYLQLYDDVVGSLLLRQVRVKSVPCKSLNGSRNTICYPPYKPEFEQTAPIVGANSSKLYTWNDTYATLFASFSFIRDYGYTSSYGTGGYAFQLSNDNNTALEQVGQLKEDNFFDGSTRAAVLSCSFYNRHTTLFTVVELLAEVPPSGLLIPTSRVDTVRVITFQWEESPNLVFFGSVFLLFLFFYAINEMLEFRARGLLGYFSEPWNFLEIIALSCFVVMTVYFGMFVVESRNIKGQIQNYVPDSYINMQTLRQYQNIVAELAGINILVSSIRIFKFLRLNSKLSLLWNTLSLAFGDLAAFTAIFIILFAGYAFMGHIIFGYQVQGYHNFSSSFSKLFSFIGGNFDYDELNQASPVSGVIFFFTFMILVFLILVNVFIAIIGKYYSAACDLADKEDQEIRSSLGEEHMSLLSRLRAMRVYLVALNFRGEAHLSVGQHLKVWIFQTNPDPNEADTDSSSAATTPEPIIMSTRQRPHHLSTTSDTMELQVVRLNSPINTLECSASGRPIFVRFLSEIVNVGDVLTIRSKWTQRPPCRIQLTKMQVDQRGQYLKFRVVSGGSIHTGTLLDPTTWVKCRYLLMKYLFPTFSRFAKSRIYFADCNLPMPPRIFTEDEIETAINSLVEAQERAPRLRPNIGEFRLEKVLDQIGQLQCDDRSPDSISSSTPRSVIAPEQIGDLVQRAVRLDHLISYLRGSIGAQNFDVLVCMDHTQQPPAPATVRLSGLGPITGPLPPSPPFLSHRASSLNLPSPKHTFDIFHKIMVDSEDLERELIEAWNIKTDTQPPVENLRFDEVVARLGFLLGVKHRVGYTRGDIIKETVRILGSFPRDCFDKLDLRREFVEYVPRPFDASSIANSDQDPVVLLGDLVNVIGELVHDQWSMTKLLDGWRYGVYRDNNMKIHNLLVPYADLAPEEQKYDIKMAVLILRMTVALGYRIIRTDEAQQPMEVWDLQAQYADRLRSGYTIHVLNTQNIGMSESLKELADVLAENSHDLWAKERKAEGWRHGETVDPRLKTNPDLIPYGLMTDDQKKSDLNTVTSSIKNVIALGYRIEFDRGKHFLRHLLGGM